MKIPVRAGITEKGFKTALKDYKEYDIVEELAANSYDADASTVVVLLDRSKDILHVFDDGTGFEVEAITGIATLGGGTKGDDIPYHRSKRPYLGSYGFGLKATLNFAKKFDLTSFSDEATFTGTIDWDLLPKALEENAFDFEKASPRRGVRGTHIAFKLRSPPNPDALERYLAALSNLPTDEGAFRCFVGEYQAVAHRFRDLEKSLRTLASRANALQRKELLKSAKESRDADLTACTHTTKRDKERKLAADFYFGGFNNDEVQQIKKGLRGIYVKVNGRILKQSFADEKFTYNISKWVKFVSGLRVEITADWLRDQITLARDGVRFARQHDEDAFKRGLQGLISDFIRPHLARLEKKAVQRAKRAETQREFLARARLKNAKTSTWVVKAPFGFRPETDAELALLLANQPVLDAIQPGLKLIDYNAQAPYDCTLYSDKDGCFRKVELEPTLPDFLWHDDKSDVEWVVVRDVGGWRMGAMKKGKGGHFKLIKDDKAKKGRYTLLEYASAKAKKTRKMYDVFAVGELLGKE